MCKAIASAVAFFFAMLSFKSFLRWLPAFAVMSVIFWFSSQPSSELPNFGWLDRILKKSGHIFEYGVLSFWVWYALDFRENRRWLAWLLAVLYAVTDEFHQSFVPGRHPSVWDVAIFDNIGALTSLWLASRRAFSISERELRKPANSGNKP